MAPETRAIYHDALDRMTSSLAEGAGAEAALPFLELIANDEEAAVLSGSDDGMDGLAAYLPIDVAEIRAELDHGDAPHPTDPSRLARIGTPTLLVHGLAHGSPGASRWFTDSTRYAAEHIPGAALRRIPGNGHLGHLLHPDRVADLLVPFLESAHENAVGRA
jgi:pimeloyl-ACP methyl ester carboxylesterase